MVGTVVVSGDYNLQGLEDALNREELRAVQVTGLGLGPKMQTLVTLVPHDRDQDLDPLSLRLSGEQNKGVKVFSSQGAYVCGQPVKVDGWRIPTV